MIKASKQNLQIEGERINIVFELNHIFDLFIHEHPEMFLGVMTAWVDIFSEKADNLTKEPEFLLGVVGNMSDDYIKMCKGKDIEDDK